MSAIEEDIHPINSIFSRTAALPTKKLPLLRADREPAIAVAMRISFRGPKSANSNAQDARALQSLLRAVCTAHEVHRDRLSLQVARLRSSIAAG
jgi:hypothetical protein